jgi:hypothetical protein
MMDGFDAGEEWRKRVGAKQNKVYRTPLTIR